MHISKISQKGKEKGSVLTIDNGLGHQVRHVTGATQVQTVCDPLPRHRGMTAQQPRQFSFGGVTLAPLFKPSLLIVSTDSFRGTSGGED